MECLGTLPGVATNFSTLDLQEPFGWLLELSIKKINERYITLHVKEDHRHKRHMVQLNDSLKPELNHNTRMRWSYLIFLKM